MQPIAVGFAGLAAQNRPRVRPFSADAEYGALKPIQHIGARFDTIAMNNLLPQCGRRDSNPHG